MTWKPRGNEEGEDYSECKEASTSMKVWKQMYSVRSTKGTFPLVRSYVGRYVFVSVRVYWGRIVLLSHLQQPFVESHCLSISFVAGKCWYTVFMLVKISKVEYCIESSNLLGGVLANFSDFVRRRDVEVHICTHYYTKHVCIHNILFPYVEEYIILTILKVRKVDSDVRGGVLENFLGSIQRGGLKSNWCTHFYLNNVWFNTMVLPYVQ